MYNNFIISILNISLLLLTFNFTLTNANDELGFITYSFNKNELNYYKNETKKLFNHAIDNYLSLAYPFDELKPISCVPKTRNFTYSLDLITNDVLGNYSVTLIDSLTTAAIMNDPIRFNNLINLVNNTFYEKKFDIDSTVQVFETTIRILGGLISSHLYAIDKRKKVYLGESYNGFLLDLAIDIADRLLPAYITVTGLPLARINLHDGIDNIDPKLYQENNIAAIMSPIFEFTILSYLTKDEKYEKITRYAFNKTWKFRSQLNLLPMSMNPMTEQRFSSLTGIGASIDSFYEIALKGSVLFNDKHLYDVWKTSYAALNIISKSDWFFTNVNYETGQTATPWIDSLSAFFPGIQVLSGDINDATFKNLMSLKLWNNFGGIPERWNFQLTDIDKLQFNSLNEFDKLQKSLPLEWYPLRPEFIESTYFLYRATKDPFYLNVGYQILLQLKFKFKTNCGFAGIQNIITGEPQDRMESFLLSETLKYLYLLFDDDNEIHNTSDNIILSTEAHPMWLTLDQINDYKINKYFNDTKYTKHLSRCYYRDKYPNQNFLQNIKNEGVTKAIQNIFSRSSSDDIDQNIEDNSNIEPNELDLIPEITDICSLKDHSLFMQNLIDKNNKDSSSLTIFQGSKIMSNFNRLSEPDYRYSDTLIKPSYLNEKTFETVQEFYDMWTDTSKGHCKLPHTTTLYELLFHIPGEYTLLPQNNGNFFCNDLAGDRRLIVEKLTPGDMSTSGELISKSLIEETAFEDISKVKKETVETFKDGKYVLKATVIDGKAIPNNASILLDQFALSMIKKPNIPDVPDFNFYKLFGVNSEGQIMLHGIPIINILVV